MGTLISVAAIGDDVKLAVDISGLASERLSVGDSVAVNGICLTINHCAQNVACFDVSSETLSNGLIGGWQVGERVNLELALTLQTPLGGHLLSGHVDGTATVIERKDAQEFTAMQFETETAIGKFIAVKGALAIDGVSLTTNTVQDRNKRTQFGIMLVPHTLAETTLGNLEKNAQVHVEVDQIARYIQRLSEYVENPDN